MAIVGLLLGLALVASAAALPAGAATITTFPIEAGSPVGKHVPGYIASSPLTGELWFTDTGSAPAVRSISTGGAPLEAVVSRPSGDLSFTPGGRLFWTVESTTGTPYVEFRDINGESNYISLSGVADPYAVIAGSSAGEYLFTARQEKGTQFGFCRASCKFVASSRLTDLEETPDGQVWAMQPEGPAAIRMSDEFKVPLPAGSGPGRAAIGPDGDLWIAGFGTGNDSSNTLNQIIRLTPSGEQKSFVLPPGRGPDDITLGPDGALWFTEYISNSIGRMTTSGEYSSCPLPNAAADPKPIGITTGADGAIWFTESGAGAIGRLTGNCVASTAITPTSGPGANGGADTTKPVLGALKLSRSSFNTKVGTKVSFTLSEPSAVVFTVQKKARGRKVGKKCKAQTRSNADGKRCVRLSAVSGSLPVAGRTGQNTFTFKGKFGSRTLRPGRYLLSGTATDAAKNASLPSAIGFTIVRLN
jgi:streptogramin lyase